MNIIPKQLLFTSLLMLALVFAANAQPEKKDKKNCPGANGLTEAEINAILDVHNQARDDVGVPKLTWNCRLADLAQEWATAGKTEHREDFNNYGENMFVSILADTSPDFGIQWWLTEKSSWNNSTGTCATGKNCTHYTQIVWRKTTEIGCGINRNLTGKWKTMMVCNYNPSGNYGEKHISAGMNEG